MVKHINNIIKAIASTRAAFLFAVLGTIAQTYHTYSVAYDLSSLTGYNKVIQAVIIALFLSGALLYYTIQAGNADSELKKIRYNGIANAFAVFESFINLYYWAKKLILVPVLEMGQDLTPQLWYKMVIGAVFAIAIPVVLKNYAGEIKTAKLEDNNSKDKVSKLSGKILDDHGKRLQKLEEHNPIPKPPIPK